MPPTFVEAENPTSVMRPLAGVIQQGKLHTLCTHSIPDICVHAPHFWFHLHLFFFLEVDLFVSVVLIKVLATESLLRSGMRPPLLWLKMLGINGSHWLVSVCPFGSIGVCPFTSV